MTHHVLTKRELNRALLMRQMLLEREAVSTAEAIERVVALQAQIPNPPYIGLWSRVKDFQRDQLTQTMEAKQAVRGVMLRSTLHVTSSQDHQWLRPTLAPAIESAFMSFFGKRLDGLEIEKLIKIAKPFLEETPRSKGELKQRLLEVQPDADADTMVYAVRTFLPIVQVPPGGTWGKGSAASYVTVEQWLGQLEAPDIHKLIRRYLSAFGPASVMDFQAWAGMTRMKKTFDTLRKDLRVYQSEGGKELFDLPDMQIPPAETPAPPRFVPEYDNLVLSHSDRTRIIADEDYRKVFLTAARVRATILVDGFVGGTWRTDRTRDTATLIVEPFRPLEKPVIDALTNEGDRLIRFIEDDATSYDVRFEPI